MTLLGPALLALVIDVQPRAPRIRVLMSGSDPPPLVIPSWPPPDADDSATWTDRRSAGPLGRRADALFEALFRRSLEHELEQDYRSYVPGTTQLEGDAPGYTGVVRLVRTLVSSRGAGAMTSSWRVLRGLFPNWPPRYGDEAATPPPAARPGLLFWFERLFARPFPAFSAKLNAWVTWWAGQWLMGPCAVEDLSAEDAAKAVVGDGAGQQLLVKRCRFLEEAACASVCVNACKVPTQAFFNVSALLPRRPARPPRPPPPPALTRARGAHRRTWVCLYASCRTTRLSSAASSSGSRPTMTRRRRRGAWRASRRVQARGS